MITYRYHMIGDTPKRASTIAKVLKDADCTVKRRKRLIALKTTDTVKLQRALMLLRRNGYPEAKSTIRISIDSVSDKDV